jgi:hypothetical protein
MKITEETYFDYLDNLLNAEEIKVFEEHLKNNPEAQEKLKQLKTLDSSISNNFNQEKFDRVTDKFNDQFNNLQKKLDHKEKDENIFKVRIFSKIFTPIIAIPFQSKALLFAAAVGIFFIGNQHNLKTNLQFADLSNSIIKNNPLLFDDNSQGKTIPLKFKNKEIFATPMKNFDKKTFNEKLNRKCPNNSVSKKIKISKNTNEFEESYYIFCNIENNWKLNFIAIKSNSKEIEIEGSYKLISKDDYIYLYPKN